MDGHEPDRRHWDEITPVHIRSGTYDLEGFIPGRLEPKRSDGDEKSATGEKKERPIRQISVRKEELAADSAD